MFPEALAFWAAQTPDAVALLAPGREPATYQELHEAVNRLAEELGALGLRRHDGIALLLPEGPELCVLLLATIRGWDRRTPGLAAPGGRSCQNPEQPAGARPRGLP